VFAEQRIPDKARVYWCPWNITPCCLACTTLHHKMNCSDTVNVCCPSLSDDCYTCAHWVAECESEPARLACWHDKNHAFIGVRCEHIACWSCYPCYCREFLVGDTVTCDLTTVNRGSTYRQRLVSTGTNKNKTNKISLWVTINGLLITVIIIILRHRCINTSSSIGRHVIYFHFLLNAIRQLYLIILCKQL